MKIYLDNSIIGRLVDIDQGVKAPEPRLEQDMAVLPEHIAMCRTHSDMFCISADAEMEIAKVGRDDRRKELLQKLKAFMLLPSADEQDETNSLAMSLEQFLLSKTHITRAEKGEAVNWDAVHLASFRVNSCHTFLTTDYGSIWAYYHTLKRLYSINVKRPTELYSELKMTFTKTVLLERHG